VPSLLGLAPDAVYQASMSPCCRWALTPPFHPYRKISGGIFSVALALGQAFTLIPLGVTHHPALRSPDFPRKL